MVYTPIGTIVVHNNRLFESTDLTKPLSSYAQSEAYLIVVKNTRKYVLSLSKILTFVPSLNLTAPVSTALTSLLNDIFVTQYLADHIPVKESLGFYNNRLDVFSPTAFRDHQVHFTSVNTPNILDDVSKKGFLDDLAIVSSRDMTHYLVAVNGVFHKTAYLNNVLYVLDGFRTMRLSGRKDIQIVDTKALGGHTIIPLTSANVTQSDWQKPALVTLSQSISGKTIFPVIDGYFYHRDFDVIDVIDPNHLRLITTKLPLIQQFRHNPRTVHRQDLFGPDATQTSRKYTDPYDAVFLSSDYVAKDTLKTSAFQYSRLKAFHSFLVVMNNPNIYTLSQVISPTDTPQFYQDLSDKTLSGMLNYGCGLCPSYLIWQDPFKRKSILLPDQDYDTDWQDQSVSPSFIPSLTKDTVNGVRIPAQFFDYVAA